jgi:hypothetical protein
VLIEHLYNQEDTGSPAGAIILTEVSKGSGSGSGDGHFAPDMRKLKARKQAKAAPVAEVVEPERRKRKVRKAARGNGKAEQVEVGDDSEDLEAQGVFFPKKRKKKEKKDLADPGVSDPVLQPSADPQAMLPLEPQPTVQPMGPPRVDMLPQQQSPVSNEGSLVLYHLDAKDLGTINILTNFLVDMGYIRAPDAGLMFKFAIEYLRVGVMKEIDASLENAAQQTS